MLFDFNHPLAGHPVEFEVQLIGIRERPRRENDAVREHDPQEILPPRAASVPGWTAPSRSSSARCKFGAPIYVRHEIVHNTYVVNDLSAKGAIFIEDLRGAARRHAGVQAHGVSQAVRARPGAGFRVFDATCPLVTKVHVEGPSCTARATSSS